MPSQLNGKRAPGRVRPISGQPRCPRNGTADDEALRGLVSVGAHTTGGASLREGRRRRSASPDTGQQAGRASCSAHVACDRGEAVACLLRELRHDCHLEAPRPSRHAAGASRSPFVSLFSFSLASVPMPSPPTARSAPVVVTATREPTALGRSTATSSSSTPTRSATSSADSVEDLLRRVAGIQLVAQRRAGPELGLLHPRRQHEQHGRAGRRRAGRLGDARPGRVRGARAWRRSSASRSCADRRRACTAPMRSAAWSRSSPAAATARRARRAAAEVGGYALVPRRRRRERRRRAVGLRAVARPRAEPRRLGDRARRSVRPRSTPTATASSATRATLQLGFTPAPGHRIGVASLETRLNAQYDGTEFLPPLRADPSPDFRNQLTTRVASLDYRGEPTQHWTTTRPGSRARSTT